jgi:hypothetical protein
MLSAMAIKGSTGEASTHERFYCGDTGTASQERLDLSAFGMGANPALWPFARERRLHDPLLPIPVPYRNPS